MAQQMHNHDHIINEEKQYQTDLNIETNEENQPQILYIERHDFDCPLCFQLLYEPITLECGHTYCRDCLYQTFQYKKHCPICRHHSSIDTITHSPNVLISKLLEKYNTNAYQTRAKEMQNIKSFRKSRHPIFISHTPEYPHCEISLHIFEAKYRVMVNRILNSDSKFIISYMQYQHYPAQTPHSIGTLCQIKNCHSFLDGRSHIKVMGLKRVKLTNIKLERDSFGLLSAEIDDYLDINISNTDITSSNSIDAKISNKLRKNSSTTAVRKTELDSFWQFVSKLQTNVNENLKFESRKWLNNAEEEKTNESEMDIKESDMMDRLLLSVERFIEQEEGSNTEVFYQRVGHPPKNIAQFSLWIAGALPRRLSQSGGTNVEISQLQLQILVSRSVTERLKLAQNLANICIQCSQKRSKVQFWIIVCIIALAILYELLNGS